MDRLRAREPAPRSYVGIAVAGTRFALDVRRVRQIVRPGEVASLPLAPAGVAGVAHHRGEIVPVIELRRRLGTSAEASASSARPLWVMVRSREGRLVALVVDEVEGVFPSSPRESIAPAPVCAVHLRGGALVLELDVEQLIGPALLALPAASEGSAT